MYSKIKSFVGNIILKLINQTIGKIEWAIINKQEQPNFPPIFIIGHPRSGTTLLYQILCSHLELVYFSNISSKLPYLPLLMSGLLKIFGVCDPKPIYNSKYGITSGWNQVNTGYFYWKRWFGTKDGIMNIKINNPKSRKELIGTIAFLTNYFDRPFVNKWTPNSSRIIELGNYFPNALFLLVRRNFLDIAQSQINARINTKGSATKAFVTWPSDYRPKETEDYIKNIVNGIYLVENGIINSIDVLGSNRFLSINYSEMCSNPLESIQRIHEFYKRITNNNIPIKNLNELPSEFPFSTGRKISKKEYYKLTSLLKDKGLLK